MVYASRQYSYKALLDELHRRGLRNMRGGKLTLCGLGNILQNPFYMGLIYVKSTGRTYQGVHKPIIAPSLWHQVQKVRSERCGPKVTRHGHLFQGLFRCGLCGDPMVPESQKQHVYYRCKKRTCPTKTIREDGLDHGVSEALHQLTLGPKAALQVQPRIDLSPLEGQRKALQLQINDEERRMDRLEDLLIDEVLSPDAFARKQSKGRLRLAELQEDLEKLPDPVTVSAHHKTLAELRNNLVLLYEMANRAEKRMIVENVWPNRTVVGRKPVLEPYSWVVRAKIDPSLLGGAPERDTCRTLMDLFDTLLTSPRDRKAG